ncbi:MAG: LCP family protein [Veillonella sp.]|nr:LCP family protein [Veillonella sp.]
MMDSQEREKELERRIRRRRAERMKKQNKISWGRFIPALLVIILLVGGLGYGLVKAGQYAYSAVTSHQSAQVTEEPLPKEATQKPNVQSVTINQEALDKPIYILLVGRDANSPSQADSLYLVSVNLDQKLVDVIGIPANSKIDNRDRTGADKINSFYTDGGIDLTKAVVEDIFHITIPYYVVVDEDAFKHMVSVIGSQSMYVEEDMNHVDATTGTTDINLRRGYQDLDAGKSLQYVRYSDDEQDVFSRVGRQERFMKTLLDSMRGSLTVTNAWDVWRIWSHNESNISTWDAIKLVYKITHMDPANIRFYILPGHKDTIEDQKYWVIDPSEAQRLVGIMTGDISNTTLAPMTTLPPAVKETKAPEDDPVNTPYNQMSQDQRAQVHETEPTKDKGI